MKISVDGNSKPLVGILGLGIMGGAIAANLIKSGRAVIGYDPDSKQQLAAQEIGVTVYDNAQSVVEGTDIILLSLPNSEALNDTIEALCSPSLSQYSGRIFADLSTLDLDYKLAKRDLLGDAGIKFLDCPISGTGAQAATGDIAIYASGNEAAYLQLIPVFEDFARSIHYLGKFGQGTKMKFVANLLVAIHNVATAEAVVLGKSCGLDPHLLCDVIKVGAGSSRIFELRSPLMVDDVFTPPTMKLEVWQKDMALIAKFAESLGAPTPLFSATIPVYEDAIKKGLGQYDTAAVSRVLDSMVTVTEDT